MSQAAGILARLHPHSYLTIARYAPPHSYLIAQPTIKGVPWPSLALFKPSPFSNPPSLSPFPPSLHVAMAGLPLSTFSLSPCLSIIKL